MKTALIFASSILLVFSGCVSSQGAPSWVRSTPEDTAQSAYFTGLGSSDSGDEAEAKNQAVYSMVGEVTRYLGVRISSEVSVNAKDTLEEFQSTIEQSIRESSKARLEEFRIADQYIERSNGKVTVYLLGEYDRQALEKEKKRIQQVFAEQQQAVSGPEGEGDALASRGQNFKAAVKYMEAAGAAARSDLDNKDIKFERNINKAKAAFAGMEINVVNTSFTGMQNEALPEFRVIVTNTDGIPQEGAVLRITYRELGDRNRFQTKTGQILTGPDGTGGVHLPVPAFIGEEMLRVSFDIRGNMDTFLSLDDSYIEMAEGIEIAANSKKLEYSYRVVSPLAGMRVVVAARDLDSGGAVIDPSQVSVGMMEVLGSADFIVTKTDVKLNGTAASEMAGEAVKASGVTNGRVMLGEAKVVEFSQEDGKTLVKVSGTGYLVDIASGSILYTTADFQKNAIGSSTQAALVSAFRQLGKLIAEDLVNNLR